MEVEIHAQLVSFILKWTIPIISNPHYAANGEHLRVSNLYELTKVQNIVCNGEGMIIVNNKGFSPKFAVLFAYKYELI